jgi:hypothetical protein
MIRLGEYCLPLVPPSSAGEPACGGLHYPRTLPCVTFPDSALVSASGR